MIGLGRAAVAGALALAASGAATAAAQARPEPSRVLVMPFASDRADSRAFWLGEASAVLLAEDLRALGVDAITREERTEAFDRLQVPESASLTDATVIRVGQLVGAHQVIVGALELHGDDMVAHARRIAIDTAQIDATASASGPLTNLFAVIERLARSMTSPAAPDAPLARAYPPVAAFELYVKGLLAETPVYAVNYLQNAIRQAPDFDRARLALWDVYNALSDHERALAVVEPVADASAWARQARFDAGLSELGLERYDAALATFRALADAQPSAAVLNNLGVVALRRDPTAAAAAAAEFARAAAADPDEPDYRFNTGYAYWRAGDWVDAVHWLREAVRRAPGDADAHIVLSAALAAEGSAGEAARERELAGRLSSDYEPSADAAPVAVPEHLERVRGAVELPRQLTIEAALASSEEREQRTLAGEYLARGRTFFDQERDREAADALNRALFISPYDADANLLLGRLHLRNGRPREAVDALKISLWSRESAQAHLALAQAYVALKERSAAVDEAGRALELDPTLTEAQDIVDATGDVP